jgi:hypothetical protein
MPASLLKRALAAGIGAVVAVIVVVVVVANRPDPAPNPPPDPNGPGPPDPVAPGPTPTRGEQVDPSAPKVWIAANGSSAGEIVRGWPLLLEAGIFHPAAFQPGAPKKPLLLAAKEGPWSNALRVEIKDARDEPQSWPLHLTDSPPAVLSLEARTTGELTWWLSPEETAKLPEGGYELVAVLDTTHATAPDGWRGRTVSVPLAIRVRKEPSPLPPQQEAEKYQLLAAYHLLRGDAKQALALADELLKKQPDNLGGLQLKGDLLARDGKTEEALAAYDRALEVFLKKYGTKEGPPRDLLKKRNELLNKLPKKQP